MESASEAGELVFESVEELAAWKAKAHHTADAFKQRGKTLSRGNGTDARGQTFMMEWSEKGLSQHLPPQPLTYPVKVQLFFEEDRRGSKQQKNATEEEQQQPQQPNATGSGAGQPARGLETLYCFALVRPGSYEIGLMTMQRDMDVGIFACDEHTILSNQALGSGFNTSLVQSDLTCEMGGEFHTAMNTDIFMAVWTKVIMLGRYRDHDWTVKVDPDTVFFPLRLRLAAAFHNVPPEGAYLNNCKYGLHGPLEVFSREAVKRWASGSANCVTYFNKICHGPCAWGEDMFIDQCLSRVIKIPRLNDWNLLSEDHCDSTDWEQCQNGGVAFHPFKTVEGFRGCLARAHGGAASSSQ
jgi:hypothetical protein